MLLKGIITLLCNTTIDTISNSFNVTSCNLKFRQLNTTGTEVISTVTPQATIPQVIPQVQEEPNSDNETARYTPTIIAGSGIGLITLASIIAFFLKKNEPEELQEEESDFLKVDNIKEPENILSSNQFQRTYNII